MKRTKILISCDTKCEIDDQFAITYAVKSPACDLLGVISTQNPQDGLPSVDIYHREAKRVLSKCGSNVSAVKGSALPFDKADKGARHRAASCIVDLVGKHGAKMHIVVTGPLTDVALACRQAPEIMKNSRIAFVGCFRNNAEAKEFKWWESNMSLDLAAFECVMKSGADLTIIPAWYCTSQLIVELACLIEKLDACGTPITKYLSQLCRERLKTGHLFAGRFKALWDLAGVAVALGIGVEKERKIPTPSVKNGRLTFRSKGEPTARMIEWIDPPAIMADSMKWIMS